MKNISLKLDEDIFDKTEELSNQMKISRNRYINNALKFYNKYQTRAIIEEKLKLESEKSKDQSMEILEEFDISTNTDETI